MLGRSHLGGSMEQRIAYQSNRRLLLAGCVDVLIAVKSFVTTREAPHVAQRHFENKHSMGVEEEVTSAINSGLSCEVSRSAQSTSFGQHSVP